MPRARRGRLRDSAVRGGHRGRRVRRRRRWPGPERVRGDGARRGGRGGQSRHRRGAGTLIMMRSLRSRVVGGMALLVGLVFVIALLGVNSIRALDESVERELSLLMESTDLGSGD